jgi:hypothetical protein
MCVSYWMEKQTGYVHIVEYWYSQHGPKRIVLGESSQAQSFIQYQSIYVNSPEKEQKTNSGCPELGVWKKIWQ